jgi:hypothetical protein
MKSRSEAFQDGHGMRIPATQHHDAEVPEHLQGLWKAHKAVATAGAIGGLLKPGGAGRAANFAFGMHLHPGNTPFGRQYTRQLHEHAANRHETEQNVARAATPARAKSGPSPWGQPTGTSQPGAIPKPFEPSKPPKKTAGEKLHEERRKTASHSEEEKRKTASLVHAQRMEELQAKANRASQSTSPRKKNAPAEGAPSSAGAKETPTISEEEWQKRKTGKAAAFDKPKVRNGTSQGQPKLNG